MKLSHAAAALLLASSSNAAFAAAPTTFVHLFEWRWSDVAQECETFLGPNGFAAVQVSPPNEHIQGSQWWTRYQPVSYLLESRGGSRAAFINMVQRCNAAGVAIYVDAIINHMANGSGVGTAGSNYGNRQYPIYSGQDFHAACAINGSDYGNNRWRVQNCELSGLPDLNTGAPYVQNTIAAYMNELTSLGVKGFRLDAAKHMSVEDIAAIRGKLTGAPLIYQEVIDQGGEAITSSEYTGQGLVIEFKYSTQLGNVFKTGRLASLRNFGEGWGFLPSSRAVVFVDNHDNQRGHGGAGNVVTYKDGRMYDLANVFMLAYPYGYTQVMSSYDYKGDTDAGGPGIPVHQNGQLNCFGTDWKCEHRWSYIAGAAQFRNNTVNEWRVTNWWDNGNNQIAFGRGAAGFVAINKESYALNTSLATSMAPGQYCNVLKGKRSSDQKSCTGEVITVGGDGRIQANVASWDAFAIHQDSKLTTGGGTPGADWRRTVVFIQAQTLSGQDMFVRGGLDHQVALNQKGLSCTATNFLCAMPIRHRNLKNATTAPWKANDNYLDWYGREASQSATAEGTPLDWTTNLWPSSWGALRTVPVDGYGQEVLNTFGQHYWMMDVDMDCSKTLNGWFELKAYVKNGQGWEGDISQANPPYATKNHLAQCGKLNKFEFGSSAALVTNL